MSEHGDVTRVPDEHQHDHRAPAPTQRQGRIYYGGRAGPRYSAPADTDHPHPMSDGVQQSCGLDPGRATMTWVKIGDSRRPNIAAGGGRIGCRATKDGTVTVAGRTIATMVRARPGVTDIC